MFNLNTKLSHYMNNSVFEIDEQCATSNNVEFSNSSEESDNESVVYSSFYLAKLIKF